MRVPLFASELLSRGAPDFAMWAGCGGGVRHAGRQQITARCNLHRVVCSMCCLRVLLYRRQEAWLLGMPPLLERSAPLHRTAVQDAGTTSRSQPWLTASRWGRDKRGRRKSAAISPNELSWEHVGKMRANIAKCCKVWQRVQTLNKILQNVWEL